MWPTVTVVSLLAALSLASPFEQDPFKPGPFKHVGRSAYVEKRDGGDSQYLAVVNGWVEDISWLGQVSPSQRPTTNVPGLIANGNLINPAPPGCKAGEPVTSCGGSSSSSTGGGGDTGSSSSTSVAAVAGGSSSSSVVYCDGSSEPTSTSVSVAAVAGTSGSGTSPTGGSVPDTSPTPSANPPPSSTPASSSASLPASTTTPTTTTLSNTTTTGASGCPSDMKGVTFNGGFNPGMFDTIAAASDWLTFGLDGATGASANAQAGYIPMMAFASDVPAAVDIVTGVKGTPPKWMLTFNEPDFSYGGVTPTMNASEAAAAIKPLLTAKNDAGVKFVAPVTADPTSSWLTDFYAACDCQGFFSAYNIHIYTPTSAAVEQSLTAFHEKFGDKNIWVTEIAPGMADPPCSLGWDTVNTFMQDVYRFAAGSGFVDRVFWNTGNQIGADDHNVCNSYLIGSGGSPSPLLADYQAIDCK